MSWSASRTARWVLVPLLGALAALVPAAPADAHAVLVGSEPAAGAVVAGPLPAVTLRFSEPVSARQTGADLLDGSGRRVPGVSARVDRQVLRLALPALAAGTYGVAWHALGDTDGHLTRGMLVFSLGRPSAATALSGVAITGTDPAAPDVLRRVALLAALCAMAGGAAVAGLALRPLLAARRPHPLDAVARRARQRLLRLCTAGAAAAVLLGVIDLSVQHGRAGGSWWALLTGTGWGVRWIAGTVAAAAVGGAALALRRRPDTRAWWWALAVAVAAAAGAAGASPHAGGRVAALAGGTHTLAAAVWLGAVGGLPLMVRAARDRDGTVVATGRLALLRACAPALFRMLAVAVLLGVGTGLYLAGREVAAAGDLVGTRFGWTLTAKLACVALVGAVALGNAWFWRRSRSAARTGHLAVRLILAEALAGALVLVAAGTLVETSPAAGAAPPPSGATATATAGDLVVTVSVTPNAPGANGVTVVVSSTRRPPPGAVDRVTLGIPVPGTAGTGVLDLSPAGADRFFASGDLPAPGAVTLTVTVHRAGADVPVAVPWTVGPAPAAAAPGRRLAPLVTPAAALLIAAGLGLGLWWGGLRRRRWRLSPTPPPPSGSRSAGHPSPSSRSAPAGSPASAGPPLAAAPHAPQARTLEDVS